MEHASTRTDERQKERPLSRSPARRGKALGIGSALAISVASIWLAAGFKREPPPPPPDPPGMKVSAEKIALASDAPQWQVLKMGAAAPACDHWGDRIPARVQIDPTRASDVGTPLRGLVTAVSVELGQEVKAGDPLFTVASPEIADLFAEKEKAALDLAAAKATLDRVKAMVASRAVPAKEEVAATQQYSGAEVALRLAEAKLASLKVSSGKDNEFTAVAPRSGVVVEKNILPAQEVAPDSGEPLVVIADLSSVWVVADLFEADAASVRAGTPASVLFPSLPGLEVKSRVETVSSVVDPERRSIPIRLRLENRARTLKPNMYAEVKLAVNSPGGAVELPATAVISDGARNYVYVQERQGEFSRRQVVASSAQDSKVFIASGVRPGESVVEEGAVLLDNQLALAR